MAKKVEEKTEEPKITGNSILGDTLKAAKGEHLNFEKRVNWNVSTGSLLLDIATGGISPSMWRNVGFMNTGKTPAMLEFMRNILEGVPNSKGLWVIAEGRGLSQENVERCGLTFVYDPAEWKVGTVFVLETKIFELFIKLVKDLVFNNPEEVRYAFVVDSVNGLQLRDDALKEITEANRVAGVPMMADKMQQSLSLGMFKYGHWMGLISQVRTEIKLDPYSKAPSRGGSFSGGNALLHGPDVILEYNAPYNGDFIMDNPAGKLNDQKSKPIGQEVRVTMVKTMIEKARKTSFMYPIKYGRKPSGVWVEREIGELMILWGLVTGTGWMTIAPNLVKELKDAGIDIPEKVQGKPNLYKIFEDNPSARDYMYKSFMEKLKR